MKPILFNTDMVQAILEGRKSVTRRVAFPNKDLRKFPRPDNPNAWWFRGRAYTSWDSAMQSPQGVLSLCKYKKGDILYVRETWAVNNITPHDPEWLYKADYDYTIKPYKNWRWRPSIHMPKEAARLFLRVTAVRVERLRSITEADMQREGVITRPLANDFEKFIAQKAFVLLWDRTIKPADLPLYGWNANPWVWVIEFERISKEAALEAQKGGEG